MIGDDKGYYGRRAIHMYVIDILLGKTPWLNTTNVCDFPPEDKRRSYTNINTGVGETMDVPPLKSYVGIYGDYGYGNISVELKGYPQVLHMLYGDVGTWKLKPIKTGNVSHTFKANGYDLVWPLDFSYVRFIPSETDPEEMVSLFIPGLDKAPPMFTRDLKMDTAPIVPYDDQFSFVSKSSDARSSFSGLNIIILLFTCVLLINTAMMEVRLNTLLWLNAIFQS